MHVSGAEKDGGTLTADKYFDNLITLIEEASSSLEIWIKEHEDDFNDNFLEDDLKSEILCEE